MRINPKRLVIIQFVTWIGLFQGYGNEQRSLIAQSTPQQVQKDGITTPLIDVATLHSKLQDESLLILDLGPEKETYDKAHIPGAIYVDWVDDITDLDQPDRYKLIGKTGMQALLQRLGTKPESRIVVYDDMASRVAVRMYWSLKYYGLDRVQVLNGGRPAWVNAGYSMTSKIPVIEKTGFLISNVNDKLSVNLDFVADRLHNPQVSLIDGRPAGQYSGAKPGKVFHTGALHKNRGHIPGAVNIFWKDNFKADGTFKSRRELEKLYSGVTGSEMIVTYCNEGLHAAPPWFVLSELLGHGDVRIYDDSMSEWANADRPIETSKEKQKK